MSSFTFSDGVSVAEVAYYVLALPVAAIVCFRHGASKANGWYFLATFCLLRIIGNAAHLATISQGLDGTAETIYLVTSSMGLSPLLMASLGLLSRVYFSMERSQNDSRARQQAIKFIQLVALVAFILAIVAATNGSTADLYNQTTLKVAIAIYAAIWVVLTLLTFGAVTSRTYQTTEKPIVVALCISLPILFVRVIYSMYVVYSSHGAGSPLSDATTATFLQLFLGTLEEMATVAVYLLAGMIVGRREDFTASHPMDTRARK